MGDCDQLDRGLPISASTATSLGLPRDAIMIWERCISLPGPVTDLVYKHVIVRRVAPDALDGEARALSRISRSGHFLCHVRQKLPGVSMEMRGLQPRARCEYDPSRWRRDRFGPVCSIPCLANFSECIDGGAELAGIVPGRA